MKAIWNLLSGLAERFARRDRERRAAYLSEATDLYDLEQRMRELDRDASLAAIWPRSGPAWER